MSTSVIALPLLLLHLIYYLPINTQERKSMNGLELTSIGAFGVERKARPGIPRHLHTGIDIRRPHNDYSNSQLIFPISAGKVISKREDGPYSQLILSHDDAEPPFWTVYEHIGGIRVNLGQEVSPHQPIARFYNRHELDAYGWQFDHFHFEIMKIAPVRIEPSALLPDRRFRSHTLVCFDEKALNDHFHDPIAFLKERL